MDYAAFLEALRKTRDFGWEFSPVAGVMRARPNPAWSFCPITAVYIHVARLYISSVEYLTAARKLHLNETLARKLSTAADGLTGTDARIRSDLLAAVGLQEVS